MRSVGRAILLAIVALGCAPQYPGEPVGSFEVVGRLEENACGAAIQALDPVTFRVELREEQGQAFWRRPDFPVVSGTALDGTYRFRSQARIVVIAADPDPDFGHPGCTVTQSEVVEVILEPVDSDAGAPTADAGEPEEPSMHLEGTHTIDIAPDVGSSCAPATAALGGPFLALPCSVDYTLEGTPSAPF